MAKFYTELTSELAQFIDQQYVFFTASAPARGRVNVSPKGMDSLRILDNKTVAYMDYTGSANETSAHVRDNGRLTIMFCSFATTPLILRLYGHAEVALPDSGAWNRYADDFAKLPGYRQLILLHIDSLQTSCGFAVPIMDLKSEREQLVQWATKKGESGLSNYRAEKNQLSIDGLPTHLHDALDKQS